MRHRIASVLAAFAAVLALPGCDMDRGNATLAPVQRVAFIADKNTAGVFEAWSARLDGDGTDATSLTGPTEPNSLVSLACSPDRSWIAVLADLVVDGVFEYVLYVVPAEGGIPTGVSGTMVEGGSIFSFAWSPDSRRLAYLADQDTDQVFELYTTLRDGSESHRASGPLTPGGSVSAAWAWAPDSSRLAYVADQDTDEVFELFSARPDGTDNFKLSGGESVGFEMAWAPDAGRIAYLAHTGTTYNTYELYTSRPDALDNIKVSGPMVHAGGVSRFFGWAPDSSRIAYLAAQDTADVFELYASRPDGSENIRLSGPLAPGGDVSGEGLWPFAWAPDSSRIAYLADQEADGAWGFYTSLSDGTGNVRISGELRKDDQQVIVLGFGWAPDSSRLAYCGWQDSFTTELYAAQPDGTGSLRVSAPLAPGGAVLAFAWAPDSSRLSYGGDQDFDDVFEVYSARPDGQGEVRLNGPLVLGGDVVAYAWAPDSSRFVYLADQDMDEVFELYATRPDGTGNSKLSGSLVPGGSVRAIACEGFTAFGPPEPPCYGGDGCGGGY